MLRLYKAFILPHLQNCSLIYYFLGTRNCDKSEQMYLRFIFNDSMPSYNELLKKANSYDTFQEQIYFYVSWISKKNYSFFVTPVIH